MSRSVFIVLLFAVSLGLISCSKGEYAEEMPALMTLKINVGMSGTWPKTRTDHSGAENDDEKMHTLRIIIVRPSGIVEKTEYIDLENEPAIERICEFGGIVSGENKRIFLVVNEHSTKTEENGIVERVVPYDFTKIEEGKLFPADTVYNLAIRLNGKTERLSGPLPMSDMHQVEVPRYSPDEQEHIWETELTVRRAAVKFTYYVTNESDKDLRVVGLEMEKMAQREYFMPRELGDGSFIVPSVNGNNEYYLFEHDFLTAVGLPAKKEKVDLLRQAGEKPIYLLEGKYEDDGTDKEDAMLNYKMALKLQCDELGPASWKTTFEYLPDLPEYLRRNTHVVVHATIRPDLEIKCEVHVHPYIGVSLDPDFGI